MPHTECVAVEEQAVHTSDALLDIHRRSHESLKNLLAHCRKLTPDELNRSWEGFGYPTIRLQLHHLIAAERYWIGVIHGRLELDEDEDRYPTIESLEGLREAVCGITEKYLRGASLEELNTPRKMITWQNKERNLAPARIVIRTQVHIYHHQGQVLALCRLTDKPAGGLDYPLE